MEPFERLSLPLAIDRRHVNAEDAHKRICLVFLALSFSFLCPRKPRRNGERRQRFSLESIDRDPRYLADLLAEGILAAQ
jgi:hypothetical protein